MIWLEQFLYIVRLPQLYGGKNMIPNWKIYPRSQGHSTVYLKNVVTDPSIEVGEYTMYDDFVRDPRDFQRNNVLYHYPECNHDKLKIGKFCSIACGAKFIFNAANHALGSLSTYPFPIFFEEWGLLTDTDSIAQAWDNHGDIVVGSEKSKCYLPAVREHTNAMCALTGRGITPDIQIPDQPVNRKLDAAAVRRGLDNILSNAVKYSDGDLCVAMTTEGEITFANQTIGGT